MRKDNTNVESGENEYKKEAEEIHWSVPSVNAITSLREKSVYMKEN